VICPPPLALELEAEELPDVVDSASTLLAANTTGPALTRFESNCERKPRLKIRRAHTKRKKKKIVRKIRSGGDEDNKVAYIVYMRC
jgi:hypothetical protein